MKEFLAKWLPISSLVKYAEKFEAEERENPNRALAKLVGHIAYAGFSVCGLMFYSGACYDSETFNPINQAKIYSQKYESFKNQKKSYDYSWERVFGEGGFADKDNNGLSSDEIESAYGSMGLEKEHGRYPKPSFEDLEKYLKEANDEVH